MKSLVANEHAAENEHVTVADVMSDACVHALLQSIFESMVDGIAVYNNDGVIVLANHAAGLILGINSEVLIGCTIIDFLSGAIREDGAPFPEDQHPAHCTLQTGQPQTNVVMGLYKPDNTLVWAAISTRLLNSPEANAKGWVVATLRDITSRMRAESNTRAGDWDDHRMAEAMLEGVAIYDRDAKLTYVNRAMARLHGATQQQLLHDATLDYIKPYVRSDQNANHPDNRPAVDRDEFDHRIFCSNSAYVDILVSISPILDDDGRYQGCAACANDITQQRRLELALRESERRFKLLTEQSQELIMRLSCNGRILYVSSVCEGMLGYAAGEMTGHNRTEFIHPEDLTTELLSMREYLCNGMSRTATFRCRRKDDTYVWLESSIIPFFDPFTGALTEVQTVSRDVTARIRMQEDPLYLNDLDALTGLYNRAYFMSILRDSLCQTATPVSMIMLDVDGLKAANDRHGLSSGDDLLRCTAAILTSVFEHQGTVARIGGDEFGVVLKAADENTTIEAVKAIKSKLNEHNAFYNGTPLRLSIGAATSSVGMDISDMLHTADVLMNQDKYAHKQRMAK